ncbi:CGNR zinc finger domain-containing protein [Cellulomonas sp.]|uniref:CGNR zinc finger domain-containing protein n=1 Tax=Cellulomonas sp. TaxID=40001 RepID=UPI003BAA1E17
MPDQLLRWVQLGSEPGVAPGSVERVRALLNTDDRFHGVDHLTGAPVGLVTLRDALRHYLSSGDATGLDALAAAHPLVVSFGGGAALEPAGGDGVVAGLLSEVHRAHASGEWTRLKACANPDCQWVYYDGSRNRSGRWCSMTECGDVMKARAYRQRSRQS